MHQSAYNSKERHVVLSRIVAKRSAPIEVINEPVQGVIVEQESKGCAFAACTVWDQLSKRKHNVKAGEEKRKEYWCGELHVQRRLTVKLRGRTEAPAIGAEGAQVLSARCAEQTPHHGPLQRLLDASIPLTQPKA